jgi:hypothetical protein
LVEPGEATKEQKREVYEDLVVKGLEKGYAPGWASQKYKAIFGKWPAGFVKEVREKHGVLMPELGVGA